MSSFSALPGRTEIGGNHTDHNWGRVLAGAVNLDNVAVAGKNNTNTIRILSEGYPKFEVDLSSLKPVAKEKYTSAALVRGICSRFQGSWIYNRRIRCMYRRWCSQRDPD